MYNISKYRRRESIEVYISNLPLGGSNPIRIQTMSNVSTMDTDACVNQTKKIVSAGSDYLRFTAQGVREATNLGVIKEKLLSLSIDIPLIADIHFNPNAADKALETVDKVRINPGNFVDTKNVNLSDDYIANQEAKVKEKFGDFVDKAKRLKKAIRIGVNHGSLSDRMLMKYGDTPEGMVNSAIEYIKVCVEKSFKDVVISMKSSNVIVMTSAVRLLVKRLEEFGLPSYPIHLGVTEAGEGEDGRIKSAIGIGSLMYDGIGDTIRVSLSEEPEFEVPVAKFLSDYICNGNGKDICSDNDTNQSEYYESIIKNDRVRCLVRTPNMKDLPICIIQNKDINIEKSELKPDFLLDGNKLYDNRVDNYCDLDTILVETDKILDYTKDELLDKLIILDSTNDKSPVYAWRMAFIKIREMGVNSPIILKRKYNNTSSIDDLRIMASVDFGTILLDGWGNGIMIENDSISTKDLLSLQFGILQATRLRITHTEFISCPGCGRTLFDLQTTVGEIKKSVSHLKGIKIGVMGCIVNGPGEMADADYGYVGSVPGKVDLYKGQECIIKGIPQNIAKETLIKLIKDNGDWVEPK